MHHIWCLDLENTKDFFERVWDYQAKKYEIAIFCCINSCSITRILKENNVPLLHHAACKEFVSLMQKAFRDSCNRCLVLYPVMQNPSTLSNRQRSMDSSTSNFKFASQSPKPEDMDIEFPASAASPPWDPNTRQFGNLSH